MKQIPITQGYVALVDDEDYERLSQHKWTAKVGKTNVYAYRRAGGRANAYVVKMHREIMDAPPGVDVDHIDGNGLNNQRANLRLATRTQNNGNRRKQSGTSQYKGVFWHKASGKWMARITENNRGTYLGLFTDEAEAARAYDKAARERFGEFARLNFPNENERAA